MTTRSASHRLSTLMLLTLIAFFVVTPLTVDLSLHLRASTAPARPRSNNPVILTIKPDLSLSLGRDVVTREGLGAALEAVTNANHNERIYVRAERGVRYRDVMVVAIALVSAGYVSVVLAWEGEPDDAK